MYSTNSTTYRYNIIYIYIGIFVLCLCAFDICLYRRHQKWPLKICLKLQCLRLNTFPSLGSQESLKRHWFYTLLRPPASERGQSCEDETQVGTNDVLFHSRWIQNGTERCDDQKRLKRGISGIPVWMVPWAWASRGTLSCPSFGKEFWLTIWPANFQDLDCLLIFSFSHLRPVLTSVVQWPTAEKKSHVNHGNHAISLQEAWRLAFFGLTSKVFLIESLARILGFSDESSKQVLRFPGNCNGKATALSASSLAEASQQL